MVEYYSREDVVEFIRSYRCSTDVAFHMEEHLNEIPAADVREVVFCENCRNWDNGKRYGTCPFCWLSDGEMGGQNFCSLGIRRDDK